MKSDAKTAYKLKRELSLFDVTVAGVGIILGAGIYALLGIAVSGAGNATWLAFLISAIVAAFTGLSYAELSSFFRGDSGEYDYCKRAYGKKFAWFVAILMILAGLISAATVALGFAGYFIALMPADLLLVAVLMIVFFSMINLSGIRMSSRFNAIATFIEFAGLLLIIILGIPKWGSVDLLDMPNGFIGVCQAGALVFFAFMGFETIIKFREETKQPDKMIPRAILLSIVITAVVYVLVSISAVSLLSYEQFGTSSGPLADVAASALGPMAFTLLAVIALFSTSNTVLLTLVAISRMIYGMAKKKSFPSILAKVHPKVATPYLAVLLVMIVTVLLALPGDIELVANVANLLLFIIFALVNVAAIILRYTSDAKRAFRMPLNIGRFPVISLIGVIVSLVLFVFSVMNVVQ